MPKLYSVGLAGESNYQSAIKALREGERVFLHPEPDNPHDPRAIAVRDGDSATIGYIPRDHWLTAAVLDEGKGTRAVVEAIPGGEGERPNRGVVLSVELGEKGAPLSPAASAAGPSPPSRASPKQLIGCGIVAIVALLALPAMCSGDAPAPDPAPDNTVAMPTDEEVIAGAAAPASDGLTGAQANALRSAKDYIRMSGFSRKGLIDQLSSEYGSGYSVADATAAVDSLDVDWNEQAARSARDYIKMSGFSCTGLVEQLSSDHGSKYTRSQAEFGAREAGAC